MYQVSDSKIFGVIDWVSYFVENFGLITKLESEKSNIGIEEAKIFEEIKIQEPESNGFDEAMDAEDLVSVLQ